uniref:tRNA/rRNA methyltransferase SpoU type domain-containing protein n=2 Tax=Homalodisca liturata TaxID=320908 RepID=A0A1B6J9J2_9HEMI
MFTKLLSKPIFRLSVVILVNENILRATPVLAKDVKPRNFARWSARKPSKVFTTDEISSAGVDTDEFFKSEFGNTDSQDKDSSQQHKGGLDKGADKNPKKGFEKVKEKRLYPPWKTVHSAEGTDYVVLEEHDFTFSKMMTHVGNRNMRRKHDLMMLEGKRLNNDALKAGLVPKKIFFTQKNYLQELNLPSGLNIPLFKLPYKTVKLWSKLDMPPGIIGFYGIPKEEDINTSDTIPVKVLCDNVRDPGNMGSIIRVAASVGCTQVILMKGCTDPWDSKVLRAAAGGHFHIPILMDMTWKEKEEFLHPSDLVFLADSNTEQKHPAGGKLPHHMYYDVDYASNSSIVVVIGGETEGLSYDAFSLAAHHKGSRVSIPMSNCVESLNSGCALSVILFEIKKQFLKGMTNRMTEKMIESKEEMGDVEESRSSRSIG